MGSQDHPSAMREVLGGVHAGRLLDVASGVGQFTRVLVDCLADFEMIVGLDSSQAAVERARAEFDGSSLRFERGDAAALPFPDASFDTVSMANSLHHMERLQEVLSEMRRVLVPGGRAIILEMHSDAREPASRNAVDLHALAAEVDRALGRFHAPVYSRAELREVIAAMELRELRIVEWESDEEAAEQAAIIDLVGKVVAQAAHLPESDHLARESEALIDRIRVHGIHSQPFLLAVGRL